MQTDVAALVAVALGASTVVLALGAMVASSIRGAFGRGTDPRGWKGTVGTVATAIPRGGVGRLAHRRLGARSTLAARLFDERLDAQVGVEVVVIEVRDGVALVAPMTEERKST